MKIKQPQPNTVLVSFIILESSKTGVQRSHTQTEVHFWEWLFIGSSPLRKVLDDILFEASPITASWPLTTFLTDDNFSSGNVGFISATQGGAVSLQEARQIGFTFGIVLWFGLGDLHYQNIVVGKQAGDKFIFAPLDIESIFEDVFLPSQTLLLPNIELPLHHSGIGAISQNLMNRI